MVKLICLIFKILQYIELKDQLQYKYSDNKNC